MMGSKGSVRRCETFFLATLLLCRGAHAVHGPAVGDSGAASRLLRIENVREATRDNERPVLDPYQASIPTEFSEVSDIWQLPRILPPDLSSEYKVLLAEHEEALREQQLETGQLLQTERADRKHRPIGLMTWLKKIAFPEIRRFRPWTTAITQHRKHLEASQEDSLLDGQGESSAEVQAKLSEANLWTNRFFVGSFLIGFLTLQATSKMKVEARESASPATAFARTGSTVTLLMASCLAMLLCALTFAAVLVFSEARNRMAHNEANEKGVAYDEMVLDSPGERAFEAGGGVVLSVAVAALGTCMWRKSGEVDVKSSLLVHFALRGAIFSTVIALGLEILGQMILNNSLGPTNEKDLSPAAVMPLMVIVGVSEEAAKAGAVIYGVFLSEYALVRAGARGCCGCCRSLLTEPRALMLAGLSVGFGFMIVENAGYLLMSSLENAHDLEQERVSNPAKHGGVLSMLGFSRGVPNRGKAHLDEEDMDPDVLRVLRVVVIFFRVLMNLHPWLTGLTAARIANSAFKECRDRASLSLGEFIRCCAPAAIIHALYDTGITIMPVTVALAVPVVCWSCTKALFREEWEVATIANGRRLQPSTLSNQADDVFLLEPIIVTPRSKAKAKAKADLAKSARRGSAQASPNQAPQSHAAGSTAQLASSPAGKPEPAETSATIPAPAA
mmetsp:Transcript_70622/g.147927  ORF Transcript_70622/g.147927 Transcript_70622/m.147927 type:complete len:673 (-) Transcript_70622:66-2084(-)